MKKLVDTNSVEFVQAKLMIDDQITLAVIASKLDDLKTEVREIKANIILRSDDHETRIRNLENTATATGAKSKAFMTNREIVLALAGLAIALLAIYYR
jgi:hypothetical protein